MALSDGDPADGGDVWFRVVTNERQIARGRVHHAAFGGNAISKPAPNKKRSWTHEMSGRLRSIVGTIASVQRDAENYCEQETKRGGAVKIFSGVIYGRVSQLRVQFENSIQMDVHFTPLDRDNAHAQFWANAMGVRLAYISEVSGSQTALIVE